MTDPIATPDVLIVGAGPAGLTAALVLARAGRAVVVLDAGNGRNAPSAHAYNVFTRDGTPPEELRRIGREQAERYGARFLDAEAVHAETTGEGCRVELADGRDFEARRLLLASGVVDELPDLPGLRAAWGHTAVHCPYCHGFELRGRPTAVMGNGATGFEFARHVTGWTDRVTLLTDGPADLTPEHREGLAARGIAVREEAVERLDVAGGEVRAVVLAGGERLPVTALYVRPAQRVRGPLADALGLARTEAGHVRVDGMGRTSVEHVWACGDMATPMQAVQAAATAGFAAGAMLNHDLVAAGSRYVS